jgi:hypothetical protein
MEHMRFQMPGMPPPLLNQPPQIFGAYGPDGLPALSHYSHDLAAHMFPDSSMLLDDTNEAKKRRIARVRAPWRPVRLFRTLRPAAVSASLTLSALS